MPCELKDLGGEGRGGTMDDGLNRVPHSSEDRERISVCMKICMKGTESSEDGNEFLHGSELRGRSTSFPVSSVCAPVYSDALRSWTISESSPVSGGISTIRKTIFGIKLCGHIEDEAQEWN